MKNYELHNRIGFRVTRVARLMEARFERMISPYGVSRLSWCVLTGVGREGVTSPSELADYISITRPAISRLLKKVEADGLIERESPPGDRRATIVKLTAEGERRLALCAKEAEALNKHFVSKLPPEDYEALMRIVGVLAEGEAATLTYL